jgi:hypothetical protein
MRRGLSIFLILFFWLGPLATIVPANEDSGLPPCCRRHGAHHCATTMRMAAMAAQARSGSRAVVTVPLSCASFPEFKDAAATTDAVATIPARLRVLVAQALTPAVEREAPRLDSARTRSSRGPPALSLS